MNVKPSQTMAQNKLLILYLLQKSGMDLTELQIMRIMGDLGLMGYFDLKESLAELSQNNHVTENQSPRGPLYGITETGAQMLDVMMNDLWLSSRTDVDQYLKDKKKELKMEAQLTGEYIKLRKGEYRVNLKVLENSATVFEVSLTVTSKTDAQKIVEKWKEHAEEVYVDVLLKLS